MSSYKKGRRKALWFAQPNVLKSFYSLVMLPISIFSTASVFALVATSSLIGTQASPINLAKRANGWNDPAAGGGSSLAYCEYLAELHQSI